MARRAGSGAGMVEGALWKKWLYFYIPLTAFVIGTLFPFYWMFVTAFRPDAELYLGRHWLAAARYRYARTAFSGGGSAVGNHGGSVTLGWLSGTANLVRLFAGVGGESFAGPSRELVGSFDARTVGVSWRQYVDPRLGVELLYARQDRSTGQRQDSWSVGLMRRW